MDPLILTREGLPPKWKRRRVTSPHSARRLRITLKTITRDGVGITGGTGRDDKRRSYSNKDIKHD
jgi:hypothetical protein